ncbi:MAG TPA: hypothetical protein VMI54_27275 [Polyangiaceae bacterium]|nr:hypothetical protein [Polyangiaceae bacterium]
MSDSKRARRFFWPATATLALFGALVSQSCGGAECLRNSDCGSHEECRQGKCDKPGATSSDHDAGAAGEGAGGMSSQ